MGQIFQYTFANGYQLMELTQITVHGFSAQQVHAQRNIMVQPSLHTYM